MAAALYRRQKLNAEVELLEKSFGILSSSRTLLLGVF